MDYLNRVRSNFNLCTVVMNYKDKLQELHLVRIDAHWEAAKHGISPDFQFLNDYPEIFNSICMHLIKRKYPTLWDFRLSNM